MSLCMTVVRARQNRAAQALMIYIFNLYLLCLIKFLKESQ